MPGTEVDKNSVAKKAEVGAFDANAHDEDDVEMLATERRRTVQTQHGDYRTVDEENIVVLVRSTTPELSAEQLATDTVWIQADELGRDAEEVHTTRCLVCRGVQFMFGFSLAEIKERHY